MGLEPGSRLGPYEIAALIGAGGMGEVYRARDTRLDRDVAIKVLPAAFAGDAERLQRFEREAKTLAALNHPHIAQIHGLEAIGDVRALIMELVVGDDLAQLLGVGALPLDDAIAIARQIAEALEAAHDRGIIHRDLKPANIKITPEGSVKVLDFGLAKALLDDISPQTSMVAHQPTITSPAHMTRVGVVLGTAAYMAPEQARGRTVDKRTDIWAFGVVLYEMLTGRRLFDGETVSDTVAAVLTSPIDIQLPRGTPAHVGRLIERCLDRDPRQRLRDIGEARIALAATDQRVDSGEAAAAPSRRFVPMLMTAFAAAVAGATAVVMLGVPARDAAPSSTNVVQASIVIPSDTPIRVSGFRMIAVSRDATKLAYVAGGRLYVRDLASGATRVIDRSDGASSPFFSADGTWIGFSSGGELLKAPVGGGSPLRMTTVPGATLGGRWYDDDSVMFSALGMGLFEVPATGGAPRRLIAPNRETQEIGLAWPQRLPSTALVLFSVYSNSIATTDEGQIVLEEPGRPASRQIIAGGSAAEYLPTGHLLFGHGNRLLAAPFDLTARRLTGAAVPVVDSVAMMQQNGAVQFAVAGNGMLAYIPAGAPIQSQIEAKSERGEVRTLTALSTLALDSLALSPDGRRLAARAAKANDDIHVIDMQHGNISRLTTDAGDEWNPLWSPDGRHMFYASNQGGVTNVYRRAVDGSGTPERVVESANDSRPGALSRDGAQLIYWERHDATGDDLFVVAMNGPRAPRRLLQTPHHERQPSLSPDGNWLAFESNESGETQVHVMLFPDGSNRRQISIDGGSEPLWSQDGSELYFVNGNSLMAVTMSSGLPGASRKIFDYSFSTLTSAYGRRYAVTKDRRFVVVRRLRGELGNEIRLILNWFEALKARVPVSSTR